MTNHLVFDGIQHIVDHAELMGLENQDRVLQEACEALQRLDELGRPNFGDWTVARLVVLVMKVLVDMVVIQTFALRPHVN